MRLFGVVLLSAGLMHAQQAAKPVSGAAKPAAPMFVLAPNEADIVTVKTPSPLWETGSQCFADGSMAMHFIMPPDPRNPRSHRHVYEVIAADGSARTIDLALVTDIKLRPGQMPMAYDMNEHDVVFLYYASEIQDNKPAVIHWYVARFDRQGQYHGAVELSLGNIRPEKIAVFDSGDDLAVLGYDKLNQLPQLEHYILSAGKAKLYVADALLGTETNLPPNVAADAKISLGDDAIKGIKLQTSVQLSQFVHYKDSVLLLQMNSSAPLFQLYANGLARTVPLPKVEGVSAESLLPSDGNLYVSYDRQDSDHSFTPQFLMELDPTTGDELRRIAESSGAPLCVHQGVFRVVRNKDSTTLEIMNASVRAK